MFGRVPLEPVEIKVKSTVERQNFLLEKSHCLYLWRVHVCPHELPAGDTTQAGVYVRHIQGGRFFV